MKRLAAGLSLALLLALPGSTLAFHHGVVGGLPTDCAAAAAGSPSDENGEAKEALKAAGLSLPLPPVGTPGQDAPQGADHCANLDHED